MPARYSNRIPGAIKLFCGKLQCEFKGLGVVDGSVCAIIGYDSGESTLKMLTLIGSDKEFVTVGGF